MAQGLSSRDNGDGPKRNKRSIAEVKLARLNELIARLNEDLQRKRCTVEAASNSIIQYCDNTTDYMVQGYVPKSEDPYAPQQSSGCCVIM